MANVRTAMGIGDWGYTAKNIKNHAGSFEEGIKVRVIGISKEGFDLEDEYRNRVLGCGFDCLK